MMTLKEQLERKIQQHYVNILYFAGLGGLWMMIYGNGWFLWMLEVIMALGVLNHAEYAWRKSPLFYVQHDLGGESS